MQKSVPEKIGVRQHMRSIFIGAPNNVLPDISSPLLDLKKKLMGQFLYIHLFVENKAAFLKQFSRAKQHLLPGGMLWVSWPKTSFCKTDLNLPTVIQMGYDLGLVESKAISINDQWSALKFTWPKQGVAYNNSYGKLAT